jgi:sialate O-acetylesterase
MKRSITSPLLAVALLLSPMAARADVKLPAIFSDHMVLQQDSTLPVWGHADAGEKITVTFGPSQGSTTAGADGKWRVDLPAVPAGTAAGTLVVAGKTTVTINDVLVGDVWLCSGQSNMAFGLAGTLDWQAQSAQFADDQIRLFHVPGTVAFAPRDDVKGVWTVCALDKAGHPPAGTAVGYFFAKNLRPILKRPIGLIDSSYGGTPAEAWTDLPTLRGNPALQTYADAFDKVSAKYPGGDSDFAQKEAEYQAQAKQLLLAAQSDPAYEAKMSKWKDDVATAQAAGKRPPAPPPAPLPPSLGVDRGLPSGLFNGMIAPLIPFSIKGIIWYQGETSAVTVESSTLYATLFPAMITDWRTQWKQGDILFLFVQLPNYKSPGADWPDLRESQLKTLSLPKTGMAVTIDVGEGGNLHPLDKADVGYRLSLIARHVAYGEKLVDIGPLYDAVTVEGSAIRVSFKPDSIGGGLVIGKSPRIDPKATPVSTTDLMGFKIAGEDKNWADAQAKIDGSKVVVSSSQVKNPVAVRYAWEGNPSCNLYNKEGLPASPFRTDDWPAMLPAPSATPPSTAPPVPAK